MANDTYEGLKSQYRLALQSTGVATDVAQMEQLRRQLREFCIANGKDLTELDAWLASELEIWAGYNAG